MMRPTTASLFFVFILTLGSCGSDRGRDRLRGGFGTNQLSVGRALLPRGEQEEYGYGAYSYILFPRAPAGDARGKKLLAVWLTFPNASDNTLTVPQSERNITYVPITNVPADSIKFETDWIANHYDVEQALNILHAQHLTERGPYIITSGAPLSMVARPRRIAVLDLSAAPEESVPAWFKHFARQSEAPERWARNGFEHILLNLHDELDRYGTSLQMVVEALPIGNKVYKVLP